MPLIIALLATFAVGVMVRLQRKSQGLAWLLSSLLIPAFVLFDAFVLPYRGGGASMWPIALVIGSFVGVLVGGIGVLTGSFCIKTKGTANQEDTPDQKPVR